MLTCDSRDVASTSQTMQCVSTFTCAVDDAADELPYRCVDRSWSAYVNSVYSATGNAFLTSTTTARTRHHLHVEGDCRLLTGEEATHRREDITGVSSQGVQIAGAELPL